MRSKPTGWQTLGDTVSGDAMRNSLLPGDTQTGDARTPAPAGWRPLGSDAGLRGFEGDLPSDLRDLPLERLDALVQARRDVGQLDQEVHTLGDASAWVTTPIAAEDFYPESGDPGSDGLIASWPISASQRSAIENAITVEEAVDFCRVRNSATIRALRYMLEAEPVTAERLLCAIRTVHGGRY